MDLVLENVLILKLNVCEIDGDSYSLLSPSIVQQLADQPKVHVNVTVAGANSATNIEEHPEFTAKKWDMHSGAASDLGRWAFCLKFLAIM